MGRRSRPDSGERRRVGDAVRAAWGVVRVRKNGQRKRKVLLALSGPGTVPFSSFTARRRLTHSRARSSRFRTRQHTQHLTEIRRPPTVQDATPGNVRCSRGGSESQERLAFVMDSIAEYRCGRDHHGVGVAVRTLEVASRPDMADLQHQHHAPRRQTFRSLHRHRVGDRRGFEIQMKRNTLRMLVASAVTASLTFSGAAAIAAEPGGRRWRGRHRLALLRPGRCPARSGRHADAQGVRGRDRRGRRSHRVLRSARVVRSCPRNHRRPSTRSTGATCG